MVLDPGVSPVADFQVLQRASAGDGCVGEEDLVAHALVLVEQGQLGPGVGPLAAHDHAGAVGVAGEVDQAGQLCDLGPGAQGAVLFQRGVPDLVGQGADGLSDLGGDGVADRERGLDPALSQSSQVGEEGLGAARAVGADEDRGPVAMRVRDLGKGLVEDRDVIGGGVRSGVARPQETCQGLAGVVQEAEHRVVAEAALVGRGGLFLLGVAGDQCGVDVQHQARQLTPSGVRWRQGASGLVRLQPGDLARLGPGCSQRGQGSRADTCRHPPCGGGGGNRTEHVALVS